MKLVLGKKYTTDESPLYIQIVNIAHVGEGYTKAKIELRYKSGIYAGFPNRT